MPVGQHAATARSRATTFFVHADAGVSGLRRWRQRARLSAERADVLAKVQPFWVPRHAHQRPGAGAGRL